MLDSVKLDSDIYFGSLDYYWPRLLRFCSRLFLSAHFMGRELMLRMIRDYYARIGRLVYPDIDSYSNVELHKCCVLFGLV